MSLPHGSSYCRLSYAWVQIHLSKCMVLTKTIPCQQNDLNWLYLPFHVHLKCDWFWSFSSSLRPLLSRGDFAHSLLLPWGHVAVFRAISGCGNCRGKYGRHRVGRSQRCCQPLQNTQHSPHNKGLCGPRGSHAETEKPFLKQMCWPPRSADCFHRAPTPCFPVPIHNSSEPPQVCELETPGCAPPASFSLWAQRSPCIRGMINVFTDIKLKFLFHLREHFHFVLISISSCFLLRSKGRHHLLCI